MKASYLALLVLVFATLPVRADSDSAAATAPVGANFITDFFGHLFGGGREPDPSPTPSPTPDPDVPDEIDTTHRANPDFSFTPGVLCTESDPDFHGEYRYGEHIPYCDRRDTAAMKRKIAAHYGIPRSEWNRYEFDHLIPLSLGGSNSIANIWPQPLAEAESYAKDRLEKELYLKMKRGEITQAEAVRRIYAWFGVEAVSEPVTVARGER